MPGRLRIYKKGERVVKHGKRTYNEKGIGDRLEVP